mmetsp:Transcript_90104/g.156015  ORF Transcript_90104/g.156015 Transcript_90104/m.156015 type:complete len:213 (+) Transcript_90104:346-984(+)
MGSLLGGHGPSIDDGDVKGLLSTAMPAPQNIATDTSESRDGGLGGGIANILTSVGGHGHHGRDLEGRGLLHGVNRLHRSGSDTSLVLEGEERSDGGQRGHHHGDGGHNRRRSGSSGLVCHAGGLGVLGLGSRLGAIELGIGGCTYGSTHSRHSGLNSGGRLDGRLHVQLLLRGVASHKCSKSDTSTHSHDSADDHALGILGLLSDWLVRHGC